VRALVVVDVRAQPVAPVEEPAGAPRGIEERRQGVLGLEAAVVGGIVGVKEAHPFLVCGRADVLRRDHEPVTEDLTGSDGAVRSRDQELRGMDEDDGAARLSRTRLNDGVVARGAEHSP
jgi:hypothetical protein